LDSDVTWNPAYIHLTRGGVQTLFIEPSSPWENGYIKSLAGSSFKSCSIEEIFDSILEA